MPLQGMIDMTQGQSLFIAFAAGAAIGAFFSLNLWSSVQKMTQQNTPWYVLYGNFILRISVVLLGFYMVMDGSWERMVSALLGFVLTRELLVRIIGSKPRAS